MSGELRWNLAVFENIRQLGEQYKKKMFCPKIDHVSLAEIS